MAGICDGRVVIVTGGARGIGREYCLMLAQEGAKVVVNDLGGDAAGSGGSQTPAQEVVAEIKATGGEAVANGADVSDWAGAKGMIDQAVKEFGKLDAIINNAGILRDRMLVNMTEEEWDLVIKVHLKGTFAPSHHAAAYWRDRAKEIGGPVNARIINTSSVSGIYGNIGQTNYGAAKAGIASFTIIAARELGRYGITVNAIAPGALTRMTENLGPPPSEERKVSGNPKWVAPIGVWLASEDSAGVTGKMFEASGNVLGIAEGWHRGPTAKPTQDPREIGAIARDLVARARKNAGMNGQDLD